MTKKLTTALLVFASLQPWDESALQFDSLKQDSSEEGLSSFETTLLSESQGEAEEGLSYEP